MTHVKDSTLPISQLPPFSGFCALVAIRAWTISTRRVWFQKHASASKQSLIATCSRGASPGDCGGDDGMLAMGPPPGGRMSALATAPTHCKTGPKGGTKPNPCGYRFAMSRRRFKSQSRGEADCSRRDSYLRQMEGISLDSDVKLVRWTRDKIKGQGTVVPGLVEG